MLKYVRLYVRDLERGGEYLVDDKALSYLNKKWILNNMKLRLINVVCNLIDDECYTKSDAIVPLLEVVDLIEQEEGMISTERLLKGRKHSNTNCAVHEKTHGG